MKINAPSIALSLLLMLGAGKAASATVPLAPSKPARPEIPTQTGTLATLAVQLMSSSNLESSLPLFERAIEVAEAIPQPSAKIQALSGIALKLSEVKQTQRSQQLFARAIQLANQTSSKFDQYQQQQALRDISIQLAQAGQIRRSLQLVKTLSSEFRKAQALNEIATILAERGNVQQAKAVLVEAAWFARGISGDYAYESNGSCGNDKFEVLSKIAGSLSLLSQLDQALQVANSVTGCSSATGESTQDYQAWAYLGILGHLATVHQTEQTWNSAQAIQSPLEQSIAWSAIAVKLIALEEIPLARSIATKVAEIPLPNGSPETFISKEEGLRDIAVKLAQKRQFDAALQVEQLMAESPQSLPIKGIEDLLPHPSTKNTTLGEIAHQAAIARRVPQALTIADQIPDVEAKALAQIAIAKELPKTGQPAQAAQLLQSLTLPPAPTNPKDYYAGYQPISRVAVALVTVRQTERALQIAQSIQQDLVKETTLTNIAVQLAQAGQLNQAMNLKNRLKGKGSIATVLQSIIAKQVKLGQLDQALKLALSLEGGSPSSQLGSEKAKLLVTIADHFVRSGQQWQALQAADAIPDDGLKADTIADIAKQAPATAANPN